MRLMAAFGAAALLVVAACGARTQLAGTAGVPPDAALAGDAGAEAATDGSAGGCHPLPNPLPWPNGGACTAQAQAQCQAWAQSLTTSGYAYATCVLGLQATGCGPGQCADTGNGGEACFCSYETPQCADDEVCVSDTPDGPRTCRKICVPRCKVTDTTCTPPGDFCWCDTNVDICPSDQVCSKGQGCLSQCPAN